MTGPSSPSQPAMRPRPVLEGLRSTRWGHIAIILAACAAIYFLGLSWRSFASSEGHRVGPAWEMLDRGDPWRITLFGQTYFRKPPGMPWAIAATSSLLGRDEAGARAAAALASTLGALAAWWFASRWFGPRLGIVAGLAMATMPQLWSPGRTAEIEALNNFGTLLAALAIVDRLLHSRRGEPPRVPADPPPTASDPAPPDIAGRIGPSSATSTSANSAVAPEPSLAPATGVIGHVFVIALGALGIIIAALAKGPASAPVLAGVVLAGAVTRRWSLRALAGVLAMAAMAAAVLIPIARAIYAANADPNAITQGAGEFLWSKGIAGALFLMPMAMVSALPVSLALMFPWGPDADRETSHRPDAARALAAARLLGWAWFLSLGVYTAIGVHNPRYVMPAACLLAPMACYVIRGAWGPLASFNAKRRLLAKRLTLNNPPAIPIILCVAAVLSTYAARRYVIGIDGRTAGATLAQLTTTARHTAAPQIIWAGGLIDARPDVLLYATQRRRELAPAWKPREIAAGELPPVGALLVLRVDADGDERTHYEAAILDARLVAIGDGEVGRYKFRVFERTAK